MNKVKVIYIGRMQQLTGVHDEELSLSKEATVLDLLSFLTQRHGEAFKSGVLTADNELQSTVKVLVNDRDIDEIDGLDTKLENSAETCVILVDFTIDGG